MLAEDSQARRTVKREEALQQSVMDGHFPIASKDAGRPGEKSKVYSDALFREAAIQWLVETDQVCRVPSYFWRLILTRIIS
jgi:hypothetical protein